MKLLARRFGAALIAALALTALPALAVEPVKVAFVDTGNTGRSVTAEAIAKSVIAEKKLFAAVISRAVDMDPFDISPEANAAQLLKEQGMDVSAHRAQQITANDVRHADVLLTMTEKHRARVIEAYPEAKDKVFLLSEFATGTAAEIADAYGKPMEVYKQMNAQVRGYVPAALDAAIKKYAKK